MVMRVGGCNELRWEGGGKMQATDVASCSRVFCESHEHHFSCAHRFVTLLLMVGGVGRLAVPCGCGLSGRVQWLFDELQEAGVVFAAEFEVFVDVELELVFDEDPQ